MLSKILASAFAVAPLTAIAAQAPGLAPAADYSAAAVAPGSWSYRPFPGGSEARFVDSTGIARLVLSCERATRKVSIAHTSSVPAASMFVWTSSMSRNLAARFEPNAMRVAADLAASDPLLDGLAFSRGRVAVVLAGGSALVVPAWPDAARTIEDCRI